MRMITIAALAALSLNAHSVEYVPDPDVAFDIIQMHDTTTWEKVCQSYEGTCDVPEGTYQVKLLDRNWNELDVLRDVSVRDSGSDGVHAPDLTAEVCALYQVLNDQSLLGSLSIPEICTKIYSVGDTGPAGGIVFYVNEGGLHGLEAATTDQSNSVWGTGIGCDDTFLGTSTAIGSGDANTDLIIAACGAGSAAGIAAAVGPGWFLPSKDELNELYENRIAHSVEYVPDPDVAFDIIQMHDTTTWEKVCQSYDGTCDVPEGTYQVKLLDRNWNELDVLRDVSVRDVVDGFVTGLYWSSSEFDNDGAWWQSFNAGLQNGDYKDSTNGVRAVRAF